MQEKGYEGLWRLSQNKMKETFLQLVRLGIGTEHNVSACVNNDWPAIQALAEQQGLAAITLDGIEKLSIEQRPSTELLLQWIGEVMQMESLYAVQQKTAAEMALLFHTNYIRTYVLKGAVIAECYSMPNHRRSVDMDCYLMPENSDFDAWKLGNDLIKGKGFEVNADFYKNSTFVLPGLMVENHKYLTPFRGNKNLASLEQVLQALLRNDTGEDRFDRTWLHRPPVMVSALFLIEHAYSHFLHEGLTWRLVLDWMMFSKKHQNDINWQEMEAYIDEFKFRKFYDAFLKLGKYLLGEIPESELTKTEKKMLADVWAPLDVHETVRGLKGKLALVGNTWRARWKYSYFTDMTWMKALWIQVKGFLFEKEPKLSL